MFRLFELLFLFLFLTIITHHVKSIVTVIYISQRYISGQRTAEPAGGKGPGYAGTMRDILAEIREELASISLMISFSRGSTRFCGPTIVRERGRV